MLSTLKAPFTAGADDSQKYFYKVLSFFFVLYLKLKCHLLQFCMVL